MTLQLHSSRRCLAFVLAACCSLSSSLGDVRMPAIFGDHMVLQQDMAIPVWGWAAPGGLVTVAFGDGKAVAKADANGNWRVALPRLPAKSEPRALTVEGKNKLRFEDVLVGEVWICSGQSNMEMQLGDDRSAPGAQGGVQDFQTVIDGANDPGLRIFRVQRKSSLFPEKDVAGKWEVCTPESAASFSAAGYFFGRELRERLRRPVGLIGSCWGGTAAQYWIGWDGLERRIETLEAVKAWAREREAAIREMPERIAAYPAEKAKFDEDLKRWSDEVENAPEFQQKKAQWEAAARAAREKGEALLPRPEPSRPRPPEPRDWQASPYLSSLFHGMIAPLVPYGIKGVIWYQGEAHAGHPNWHGYGDLLKSLIGSWREEWKQDFTFLVVQISGFTEREPAGRVRQTADGWPGVREGQFRALELPRTGLAVTYDLGDPYNIHPKDKKDVGERLALAALRSAYGVKDAVASGPVYASMKVEESRIRLAFTETGSGLKIGEWPGNPPASVRPSREELCGFAIAGEDRRFVPASAWIEGNEVLVESPEVPRPVAVRYAWANYPLANLYNHEGLPAAPFRTDGWMP